MELSMSESETGKLFIKGFLMKASIKMFKVGMNEKEVLYYNDLIEEEFMEEVMNKIKKED